MCRIGTARVLRLVLGSQLVAARSHSDNSEATKMSNNKHNNISSSSNSNNIIGEAVIIIVTVVIVMLIKCVYLSLPYTEPFMNM